MNAVSFLSCYLGGLPILLAYLVTLWSKTDLDIKSRIFRTLVSILFLVVAYIVLDWILILLDIHF